MRRDRSATATVVTSALLASASACFSDLSSLSRGDAAGAPDGGDGGALIDASIDASEPARADASEAGPPARPNLLVNGDFELGCAAWGVDFGFISESSDARSGARSCKFCMDTNWEAFLNQTVTRPVGSNETYYAEFWFKGASSPAALQAAGFVRGEITLASPSAGEAATDAPPVSSDWARATAIFKPSRDSSEITLDVRLQQTGNPAAQGNVICVLVDDVVLQQMP